MRRAGLDGGSSRLTISVQATVGPSASGSLLNSASVLPAIAVEDSAPGSNSASALVTVLGRLFLPLIMR